MDLQAFAIIFVSTTGVCFLDDLLGVVTVMKKLPSWKRALHRLAWVAMGMMLISMIQR